MAATHTLCLCNFHCYDDRATGKRCDVLVEHLTEQSADGIDMLVSIRKASAYAAQPFQFQTQGAQLQVFWVFNAVVWVDITNYGTSHVM